MTNEERDLIPQFIERIAAPPASCSRAATATEALKDHWSNFVEPSK